jgi:hypothetical protein
LIAIDAILFAQILRAAGMNLCAIIEQAQPSPGELFLRCPIISTSIFFSQIALRSGGGILVQPFVAFMLTVLDLRFWQDGRTPMDGILGDH